MTTVEYHNSDITLCGMTYSEKYDITAIKRQKIVNPVENLLSERRINISFNLRYFFPNDISKLICEYDYHLHGKSYIFKEYARNISKFDNTICFGVIMLKKYPENILSNEQIIIGKNNILSVWNLATGQRSNPEGNCDIENDLGSIIDNIYIKNIFVLSSGRIIIMSNIKTLRILNYPYRKCDCVTVIENVQCITILSDDRIAIVTGLCDEEIQIWSKSLDSMSYKCVISFITEIPLICYCVSYDEKIIAGSYIGNLCICDLQTGFSKLLNPPNIHGTSSCRARPSDIASTKYYGNGSICCMAVIPPRQYSTGVLFDERIVIGQTDCKLYIVNIQSGECELICAGHSDSVNCVAILPDGRIISSSLDKTIKIWNPENGSSNTSCECERTFEFHDDIITKIEVLSDGRIIIASSGNNVIRIMC
jgi:WD40 repeat protein